MERTLNPSTQQAGARKVYGVDASNMADHAQALVAANGLGDVISIIKGKIEDIELPEMVLTPPKLVEIQTQSASR